MCCLSNFWWRSRRKRNERFYKNRNFWNNFAPLLLVYLTLLGTSQQTIQLTMSNKFQETVYDEKNGHICSVINLFELYCRLLIENSQAKKYLAKNLRICHIAFCLICLSSLSTWICIVALKPLRFEQTVCIACAWRRVNFNR